MWGWLRTWRSRAREDDEAKREMAAHIELLAERYRRSGLSVEDAHVAARRQFGNVSVVREEVYRMNGVRWIDGISQDLRYAWRQVCRSPGFAAVVAATLALGIGGATAVFSVAQAVLLAPLPYEQPGQLVRLYQHEPNRPETRNYIAGPHFRSRARRRGGVRVGGGALHLLRGRPRSGDGRRGAAPPRDAGDRRLLPDPARRRAARPRLRSPRRHRHAPGRVERCALAHAICRRSVGDRVDGAVER